MAVVGWILVGILGLLLLFFLLVLFFPVSYRLELEKTPESLLIKAKAGWLFGLFRILFLYPEPGKPQVRIAWFHLAPEEKQKKVKSGAHKKKASRKAENAGQTSPDSGGENPPQISSGSVEETSRADLAAAGTQSFSQDKPSGEPEKDEESLKESGDSEETNKTEDSERQKSGSRKKKAVGSIAEVYRKLREEADFYWKLWQKEETKAYVSEIFARLLKIFRNVLPRRIEGKLVFGAASPDITGYVLAVYSILRVQFPKRLTVELTPDFEEPVLKGELLIRGHVTVVVLLWNILRAALDKRLRKLWREITGHIS